MPPISRKCIFSASRLQVVAAVYDVASAVGVVDVHSQTLGVGQLGAVCWAVRWPGDGNTCGINLRSFSGNPVLSHLQNVLV